jgi:hypothetical protein
MSITHDVHVLPPIVMVGLQNRQRARVTEGEQGTPGKPAA